MQNTVQAVCVICLKHFDKYSKKSSSSSSSSSNSIYKMKEASPKTYKIYWTIGEWTQMKREYEL